jgi:hypothetical protein
MSKTPDEKPTSYRIYQVLMAVIAIVMILSLIAMALR